MYRQWTERIWCCLDLLDWGRPGDVSSRGWSSPSLPCWRAPQEQLHPNLAALEFWWMWLPLLPQENVFLQNEYMSRYKGGTIIRSIIHMHAEPDRLQTEQHHAYTSHALWYNVQHVHVYNVCTAICLGRLASRTKPWSLTKDIPYRVHGAYDTVHTSWTDVGANPVVSLLASSWAIVDGGWYRNCYKCSKPRRCHRSRWWSSSTASIYSKAKGSNNQLCFLPQCWFTYKQRPVSNKQLVCSKLIRVCSCLHSYLYSVSGSGVQVLPATAVLERSYFLAFPLAHVWSVLTCGGVERVQALHCP